MTQNLNFDPNSPSQHADSIFGLPCTEKESKLVLLPVPWEATTSYGGGTSQGPAAILEASQQVDLFDLELGRFYENGIFLKPISKAILKMNTQAKAAAQRIIKAGGILKTAKLKADLKTVNTLSKKLNDDVYAESKKILSQGKILGLVGGDHSTPFGAIKAYVEKYPELGILHFDAHADLREAYEGFEHSHASIMHNVITKLPVKKLVQVGIRDFCEEEFDFIKGNSTRIKTYFDENLAQQKHQGHSWLKICEGIVSQLPKEVYISFDIDGLDPKLCPHTGTPVPGGLEFQEALTLIKTVVAAGKKIVGFDLNEVSPGPKGDEWDANVGARLLFKMCGWTFKSQ